ncbi:hypothetical protein [Zooshikella harenae]|uniref:Uncharacterized protein n=1 Tax=Zooshikella harenae TaxID=2827238 RepID=A0ABS5ZG68_9GAMM|nr:hypothetical protein [Zooshikella harenae]MBU2713059.1 hypothetical protein [Zooshikella harenae]
MLKAMGTLLLAVVSSHALADMSNAENAADSLMNAANELRKAYYFDTDKVTSVCTQLFLENGVSVGDVLCSKDSDKNLVKLLEEAANRVGTMSQ